MVITCAGGVLAYLVLRALAVPVPLALTGQALFLVLPCGTTAMRPMTEGLLLALTLAALWGCALVLGGTRPRAGLALVSCALLALFTVKHSQALFLGMCLAAAGAAVAVRRRRRGLPSGRGPVALAAVGCAGMLGTLLVSRLLDYPSTSESVQDLLTDHFARPDRERPWAEFFQLQGNFWMEWARRQMGSRCSWRRWRRARWERCDGRRSAPSWPGRPVRVCSTRRGIRTSTSGATG